MRNEDDLRARFHAMRDEEAAAAPPFSAPAPRRRTVPATRLVAAAAAVISVVGAAWLLMDRPDEDALAFLQLDRTEWLGPTDFLLEIGNRSLLSTIPEIGEIRGPGAAGQETPGSRDTLNTEGSRS